MKTYIAFNSGCNIWEVEQFDNTTEWHKNEFKGTYKECKKKADLEMNGLNKPHYSRPEYSSIYDY
tara:strand:- start:12555 stop:12749 length:195 start_codon:yes stop_codon:yes gene_type:complete